MSKFTTAGTASDPRARFCLRRLRVPSVRRAAFVATLLAHNAKRIFPMSKKKEPSAKNDDVNRRAMLTTAIAAGVALPLVTVEAQAQGHGTRVVVDLGGVELP